jgi:hypothetical protein
MRYERRGRTLVVLDELIPTEPPMRAAVLAAVLVIAPIAQAESCCKEIAYSSTPAQQAAAADVVFIGNVGDVEPDVLMAEQHPGAGKVGHMVVTLRVEESLRGAKGITHLRVGFVPTQNPMYPEQQQAFICGEGRHWRGNLNLLPGQEACFFLQKHPTSDFFVPVPMGYPLNKGHLNYASELEQVKKISRAVERPLEALRANEAGDRQLAACALVHHYRLQGRNQGRTSPVEEAVPAEVSKLILEALGGMKWGDTPFDVNGTFSLQNTFWKLQLGEKDGWRPPVQTGNEDYNAVLSDAAAKWLKENAGKYTLRRFVDVPAKQ